MNEIIVIEALLILNWIGILVLFGYQYHNNKIHAKIVKAIVDEFELHANEINWLLQNTKMKDDNK
jgi:hypothetical protein